MNKIFLSILFSMLILNPVVFGDSIDTNVEVTSVEHYPLQLGALGITIFIFALVLAGVRVLFDVMYMDFGSPSDLVSLAFYFLLSFIFIVLIIGMVFGG